jgi:acyl dehydratase
MGGAAMTVLRHMRHLPRQLPVLASLGQAVLARGRAPHAEIERMIAPLPAALVRDYVAHVGGDPAVYRDTVPPHLFPQWGLPLAAQCLAGLPYPLARVLNAGCRLEVSAPLPAGVPLTARACLVSTDDDGRRAQLSVRVVTGTREVPDAVVATIRATVTLAADKATKRSRRERLTIPYDATELARWHLDRDAGLAFALLTGDFNPIHWSTRAGKAAGFGGTILHGFAQLARAIESIVRARALASSSRPAVWDARFTRALRLPADVALFAAGSDAWVGDARGGTPYMTLRGPAELPHD